MRSCSQRSQHVPSTVPSKNPGFLRVFPVFPAFSLKLNERNTCMLEGDASPCGAYPHARLSIKETARKLGLLGLLGTAISINGLCNPNAVPTMGLLGTRPAEELLRSNDFRPGRKPQKSWVSTRDVAALLSYQSYVDNLSVLARNKIARPSPHRSRNAAGSRLRLGWSSRQQLYRCAHPSSAMDVRATNRVQRAAVGRPPLLVEGTNRPTAASHSQRIACASATAGAAHLCSRIGETS